MKMSREAFERWPHRAVTLLGMSGVGKTTLANKLPKCDWFHYSGDYRIGTKYLQEPILDNIKRKAMENEFLRDLLRSDSIYIASNISVHNLEPLSTFLGKVGNPEEGGLSREAFLERQRLHHEAEIGAMRDVVAFIRKSREIYGYDHFLNDAGGSVCELDDPKTVDLLAEHTLMVYIRADRDMEQELIARQRRYPKPLYYNELFFRRQLDSYMEEHEVTSIEAIGPDHFVQWIFPRLVEHRRPLYEAIADRHGYTVTAREVETVRDEVDFIDLVVTAIDRRAEIAA